MMSHVPYYTEAAGNKEDFHNSVVHWDESEKQIQVPTHENDGV